MSARADLANPTDPPAGNQSNIAATTDYVIGGDDLQAMTLNTHAAIKILQALTVTEDARMSFGVVEKPTGDPETIKLIATTGNIDAGNSTITIIDQTDSAAGEIKFKGGVNGGGTGTSTINVTAADSSTVTGMSFSAITGDYNGAGTESSLLTPGQSLGVIETDRTLKVGGTLTIASTVPEGMSYPELTFTIQYE